MEACREQANFRYAVCRRIAPIDNCSLAVRTVFSGGSSLSTPASAITLRKWLAARMGETAPRKWVEKCIFNVRNKGNFKHQKLYTCANNTDPRNIASETHPQEPHCSVKLLGSLIIASLLLPPILCIGRRKPPLSLVFGCWRRRRRRNGRRRHIAPGLLFGELLGLPLLLLPFPLPDLENNTKK